MPITVQVTEGLLTPVAQKEFFAGLTESILRINGVTGNSFSTRHLIGNIIVVPKEQSFAAGVNEPFVNVGLAVPEFSMKLHAMRVQFVTEMTDLLERLAEGRLVRDRIYINMLYGDGFWGVGGEALNDAGLQAAVMAAMPK